MLEIHYTNHYLKDLALIKKRGLPKKELDDIVKLLAEEKPLPEKHKDHQLKGSLSKFRECHIRPDWLLVYKKEKKILTLTLVRTGTHSDIFG
jgi:mRNA interferase YafQ